jgi:origin recognition complex subunit 5
MAACLDALDELSNDKIDRRPYARTENLNSLVVNLQRMLEEYQDKFVLVFDGIDGQREAPPTLIPALARFGEMVCSYRPSSLANPLRSANFSIRYLTFL